jgi:hypothetical protein
MSVSLSPCPYRHNRADVLENKTESCFVLGEVQATSKHSQDLQCLLGPQLTSGARPHRTRLA